jgi:hypothetical protein
MNAGEGLQNLGLCSGPPSRQGSLSCHICCDTGPRFSGLIRRTAPFSRLFDTRMCRIYCNPDTHREQINLCLKLFYSELGIQCQIEQRLKKKFNELLESYRSEIFPEMVQDWDVLPAD